MQTRIYKSPGQKMATRTRHKPSPIKCEPLPNRKASIKDSMTIEIL